MTAALIIAAWLTICALILLANHCFKLSRKTEGERLPNDSANDARVGSGKGVVTHHAAATTSTRG